MNLDTIIAYSYGHFLTHSGGRIDALTVFINYAQEELGWPHEKACRYRRQILVDDEVAMASRSFERFYLWYFINYVLDELSAGVLLEVEII